MLTANPSLWETRAAAITIAGDALADEVRRRAPECVSRLGASTNNVKPLHHSRTFGLPGRHDEALVLSVMFTFSCGPMHLHCDLMQEDGPILSDLPLRDLGVNPTDAVIDSAVADVVAFIPPLVGIIVAYLQAQQSETTRG